MTNPLHKHLAFTYYPPHGPPLNLPRCRVDPGFGYDGVVFQRSHQLTADPAEVTCGVCLVCMQTTPFWRKRAVEAD
jgi:hypothetical protein